MHRTTLYLDDELHERVRVIARRSRRSQAEVIREAIRVYSGHDEWVVPACVGVGDGPPDLSERVDDYLDGFGETPR